MRRISGHSLIFIQMKSDKRKLTRGRQGRRHNGSLLCVCVCVMDICTPCWTSLCMTVLSLAYSHRRRQNLLVCKQHSVNMAVVKTPLNLKCFERKWRQSELIYDSCDLKKRTYKEEISWAGGGPGHYFSYAKGYWWCKWCLDQSLWRGGGDMIAAIDVILQWGSLNVISIQLYLSTPVDIMVKTEFYPLSFMAVSL